MAKTGRPKSTNPADIQFRIRLTKEESATLKKCAAKLNINMSEVIRRGIRLIYQGLEKE